MKFIFFTGLMVATLAGFAQNTTTQSFRTTNYAGTYSYGNIEHGARGRAVVYPESDSTVLVFIDICTSGSSMIGQRYARVTIKNGQGIYYSKKNTDRKGCKWKLSFDNDVLTIKTLDDCNECGFGHDLRADSQYKRKMNIVPTYFTDREGRRIYFDKTSPENYTR